MKWNLIIKMKSKMKLVRLDSIFQVFYGTDLELNKLKLSSEGIRFVSRNRNLNGIVAHVKKIEGIVPNPAHSISVPLGSSSVLYAHYQDKEYYSGRDLAYLIPLEDIKLTMQQMFFYCLVLRKNRVKYNYGRQVNTTLPSLMVPAIDEIPKYVESIKIPNVKQYVESANNKKIKLDYSKFKKFKLYPDFFDMEAGTYYEKGERGEGNTPLISSTDKNNGIAELTSLEPTFQGNCITIGKVSCSTFYQDRPFCATSDCTVLIPKKGFKMDVFSGLYIASVINKESPKWNYGRQIRLNDCQELEVFLPSNKDGKPDLTFMKKYMKSLRYSKMLESQATEY